MTLNAPGIPGAVRADGHFVFATRRPARRAWTSGLPRPTPSSGTSPASGIVERRGGVTKVSLPYVSFHSTYKFASDGFELESNFNLRFRNRTEVEEALAANGFVTLDVRDAPDLPRAGVRVVTRRADRGT
jgi:hypothetical protein